MANRFASFRCVLLLLVLSFAVAATMSAAPQQRLPVGNGIVDLTADQQHKEGHIYYADGDVDVHRGTMRLQAPHAEYNDETYHLIARKQVIFDDASYLNAMKYAPMNVARNRANVAPNLVVFDDGIHHLEADRIDYDVRAGSGHFEHVHGTVHIVRPPNPLILVTPNPLTFEAQSVDRIDENTYRLHHGQLTMCDLNHPTWTYGFSEATVHINDRIAVVSTDFRVFHIPLVYLPYASVPTGRKERQSGFLLPEVGSNSVKGDVLADAYYWAPTSWADATIGAQLLTKRGWSQHIDARLLPSENVVITASYYGVVDRLNEGGHVLSVGLRANLGGGWRAVVNVNQLTSLLFQEVFAPSFNVAINSEVHTTAFLTNNFDGFSANVAVDNFKDFLTVQPQTTLTVRSLPEGRFSSVDQSPWVRWPLYFGFDVYTGAVQRTDPMIDTPPFMDRSELAPRVTLPLHLGSWLGVTPTYTLNVTRYGAEEVAGNIVETSLWRAAREFSADLRPASLERLWQRPNSTWKHTIEPQIVYNYVAGVNNFDRIIRIDQDDTLTDTNEIAYSITQRLFRRKRSDASKTYEEVASWTLLQKYYLDPSFGGALVPGTRNVFQALDSVTPFAFADGQRSVSPVVSDFKVSPGGGIEGELRTDYDPVRNRITATEMLFRTHLRSNLQLSLARYSVNPTPVLEPSSDQIRATLGYGAINHRGWNAAGTFGYDLKERLPEYETFQGGYNSSCCGISFQYQRLALGQILRENEFRIAFTIANIGAFGTLSRQNAVGGVF